VFSLKDGTPFMAFPTQKPLDSRRGKIDEDGIWHWTEHGEIDLNTFIDSARHIVYSTIANSINVKRTIRTQVEPTRNDSPACVSTAPVQRKMLTKQGQRLRVQEQ
jgi:hypothetical protein